MGMTRKNTWHRDNWDEAPAIERQWGPGQSHSSGRARVVDRLALDQPTRVRTNPRPRMEWVAMVDGEEVGTRPTMREAKALCEEKLEE